MLSATFFAFFVATMPEIATPSPTCSTVIFSSGKIFAIRIRINGSKADSAPTETS